MKLKKRSCSSPWIDSYLFIDNYKALKDETGQHEPLLFRDAVPPSPSTKLSAGGMKAGKNQVKVAETTGSRPRLNRLGALNLHRIEDTVLREDPGINAENIAYFVGARRETDPLSQKIPIILDNAGYPRAECVKDIAYGRNIELHYLPPDSPNLSPIERLWKYM